MSFVEHHGHFIKKLFMGKSDNMVFTRAFDLYIIKILCFILKEYIQVTIQVNTYTSTLLLYHL